MSLVTTAMRKRSRMALQSESTRAVLPEPTGPPTPTRRVSRADAVMGSSRFEQARVLGFVQGAREGEPGQGRADFGVGEQRGARTGCGHERAERRERALRRKLAERHQSREDADLVFGPRKGVGGHERLLGYAERRASEREEREVRHAFAPVPSGSFGDALIGQ